MGTTSGQPGSSTAWRSIAIGLVVVLVIGTGVVVWLLQRSDPKHRAKVLGVKVSKSPSPTPSTQSPRPPKQTIARAIRQSRSAVVRIETTTCDTRALGSGFIIAPGLVVTVAHVVDGYRTVAVRNGSGVTSAVVVGIDPEHEVALIRLKYQLRGQPLTFAAQNPRDGSQLAVLGYPLGRPLASSRGEFHPPALLEPCVSLSTHTAPIT